MSTNVPNLKQIGGGHRKNCQKFVDLMWNNPQPGSQTSPIVCCVWLVGAVELYDIQIIIVLFSF